MKKDTLDKILKKIDVKEEDVLSIGETWPEEDLSPVGFDEKIKGKFKYYDITLKNGDVFYLKRDHLLDIIVSIDDVGYEFVL
jgi:hypothetical protein